MIQIEKGDYSNLVLVDNFYQCGAIVANKKPYFAKSLINFDYAAHFPDSKYCQQNKLAPPKNSNPTFGAIAGRWLNSRSHGETASRCTEKMPFFAQAFSKLSICCHIG